MTVKESRGRLSYLTPDRTKPITARKLGDDFDRAAILEALTINTQNAARAAETPAPKEEYPRSIKDRLQRNKAAINAPKNDGVQRMVDIAAKRAEGKGKGYEKWATLHNLKQMAATMSVYEESGFSSPEELEAALTAASAGLNSVHAELKTVESTLREKKDLQKQLLAYIKTKPARDGLKAQKTEKARRAYREQHESEFIISESAARYFKAQGISKLPASKTLQAEIEQLTREKKKLEQQGYEIKRGKHTSVKGARQKRFIRFRTLGAGYSEDEIKAVIAGEAEHRPHQKQPPKEKPFHLLVDIQAKLSEGKSESYARWAKRYNLKEMSKTLIFLQENKIGNIEEMQERVNAATARYHELGDSIKAAEQRMAEIAVLRAHIINYAKTRPVYDAYRKAGYSKKFLEEHREQITLHRAAKATFDEAGLKKLPKVKELNTEYSTLLSQKKAAYPAYRKARDEMQELMKAQKNVEIFFAEEKTTKEKAQTR